MSLEQHWAPANALAELLNGQADDARGRLTQLTDEQLDAIDTAARRLSGLAYAVTEERRIQERKPT